MKSTAKDLLAELDRLGIAHATITHPPVFTVEEAKQLRGKIEGGHTKNLFLKDKKNTLFLAVTLEDVPVDLTALGLMIGARGRLSFASADLLREHLGVEPGSVTPFALFNNRTLTVTPVFDDAMLAVKPLNFHPLENTATTAISSADLLKFVSVCGHEPRTLRFPRRTAEAISET
ncbi:MAG: prolyl-tRNA synthetase associated domain-containing protein [Alphaproteobacteria bacterium]|nr:prolyl-tRNA synthetase associated domain-containing protein [Alphaproteobacteria bacterium]